MFLSVALSSTSALVLVRKRIGIAVRRVPARYFRCHGLGVYAVCVCNKVRLPGMANQHTSSEGQGSRDLRQTRVEPY